MRPHRPVGSSRNKKIVKPRFKLFAEGECQKIPLLVLKLEGEKIELA